MNAELIQALKLVRNGNWNAAHELVQNRSDKDACWIHAYLHRTEGDDGNAGFWYRQAGRPFPVNTLDEEWQRIHDELEQSSD